MQDMNREIKIMRDLQFQPETLPNHGVYFDKMPLAPPQSLTDIIARNGIIAKYSTTM